MTEQLLNALPIPICQIHPDPEQPRRLLPPDLTAALVVGTPPTEILTQIRERSKRDPWVRGRLEELDGLADSIAVDGLMQPIRVIQEGPEAFRIEAGERRWWAHQILVGRGDARFETIAALVVGAPLGDGGVLRRRVAENVLRSGFTAIELARAIAARVEEIRASEPALARREIEKAVGKENAMSDRRVRQFLALAKLPVDVQELAQQARLSENSLRTLSGKDPNRLMAAALALVHSQSSVQQHSGTKRRAQAKRRLKRDNGVQRRPASPVTTLVQLATLARRMKGERVQTAAKNLRARLKHDDSDRAAMVHLEAILNCAMEKAENGKRGGRKETPAESSPGENVAQ